MKPFIVPWGTYPFDVMVCLGTKPEEVMATLEKAANLNDEERAALVFEGVGRTVMLSGGQTVLWVKERRNRGVLAHEVFHAASFLFQRIEVPLTEATEEVYAYAIQHLFEAITRHKN